MQQMISDFISGSSDTQRVTRERERESLFCGENCKEMNDGKNLI